ncbi:tRNA-dihydrouridine(20) synthase [NAD(P)+]-like isoform X1 [Bombus vosnesenskii]|uniref:tRNA-dihydrouridine(20) synthase [NAD(P)+]-like isoform X1 n=1 Tax=Bombus vosnesenskii TaxID=207650 RepID=A0A6J3KPR4_9HYME|nr:tRNA-dihydrouridine(20) synthase [NAD(P)+]-like isoform X1 [Bombus vosnesenskii]XP_050470506.1 tRNA-dihydrouridine(20) synthase [NAD(P)+]-like isoform X1 [Bombus huntii]XP_050470507.1 tRNA-dihydrouridine(20) synthase [NAD(P)+]-like isoform X1 [Bombus huntii]
MNEKAGMTMERKRLNYENKLILAPMVRIGTLPMRLLALDYGADIVYTEELIDWKLLRSFRRENDVLGTVDYIDKTDGTVTFRTCLKERNKVVLQIGTCDATRALKVAKMVEQDVAGIDLNMGCPKLFSLVGKMGAALLKEPEIATNILKTLVDNLSIPVTCKIRVLPDLDKTLELCELLQSTGISAIAVHGRTVNERPQHMNRNDVLKKISDRLAIPVIANGGSKEIQKYSDIFKFKEITGCSSVMLARAAQWNCSIFSKEGLLPMEDVIKSYLKYAVDCDNSPSNTKYCIQNILREQQESTLGKKFLSSQTLEQICDLWNLIDYCLSKKKEFEEKGLLGRSQVSPMREDGKQDEGQASNKRKISEEEDVTLMHCAFLRNNYVTDLELPKTILHKWTQTQRKKMPNYDTQQKGKLFQSIVTVDGRRYGSSFWEKNKKWAEQGAALVCLFSLGLVNKKALATNCNVPC